MTWRPSRGFMCRRMQSLAEAVPGRERLSDVCWRRGVLWLRGVLSKHRSPCAMRVVGGMARYLEFVAMERCKCEGVIVRRQQ